MITYSERKLEATAETFQQESILEMFSKIYAACDNGIFRFNELEDMLSKMDTL